MVSEGPANILEVKELSVVYPGHPPKQAVRHVSLTIARGQCAGIVGGSGCGKTTIAKTIVGLERPSSGSILFEGRDLSGFTVAERRQYRRDVQMVFQDTLGALNPRIRIGQAIREVLEVHRRKEFATETGIDDCVLSLLDDVELSSDLLQRFPHEISGGQRQRIGIARALAVNPRLLIADEPVSALDVAVQAQMLKMLRRLLDKTGLTLVLIAHDLAVVRCLCDFAVVMSEGKVVEQGDPKILFSKPEAEFTKSLVDSVPDVSRAMRRRFG